MGAEVYRPPMAGTSSVDEAQADEAEDAASLLGQRRCEVLAALGLGVTAAVVVRGYAAAGAYAQVTADGGLARPTTWELVEMAAGGASLYGARAEGVTAVATLLLAYVLVVEVGPGSWIGSLGVRVLQGVVAVGALLAVGGAVVTVAALRQQGQIEAFGAGGPLGAADADVLTQVLDRGGSALPVVAGAALAGYLAWLASSALIELRRAPGPEPDDDAMDPYGADLDPGAADGV